MPAEDFVSVIGALSEGLTFQRLLTLELIPDAAFAALAPERPKPAGLERLLRLALLVVAVALFVLAGGHQLGRRFRQCVERQVAELFGVQLVEAAVGGGQKFRQGDVAVEIEVRSRQRLGLIQQAIDRRALQHRIGAGGRTLGLGGAPRTTAMTAATHPAAASAATAARG